MHKTCCGRLPGAPQYSLSPKQRTCVTLFGNSIFAEVKFKIERQVSLWELGQTWRHGGEGNGKTGRAWSDSSVSPGSCPRASRKVAQPRGHLRLYFWSEL